MRLSEFWSLADAVFGPGYSRTLARELALDAAGSMTCEQALAGGVAARDVWHALCDQMDVPMDQRDGGLRENLVPPRRP
ncbi:DUF3046 domain-containing protein [Demequina sp. B12]|uniref:DUF3046 domain-containing protein n=1 Tax=Demequina sp. B12 TaxID=2992757 RepID=UPI00237A7B44|nr:DUF3046 domain-containing protein [Demequina sp. B12]MDE0573361.1 DUF3046 domain-containing protein [Demequina sp. B12]